MLALESVTLGYGSRVVLDALTLKVDPGEVVALIGPNGAGKSTVIRAASGVIRPLRGRIEVDGADVHRIPPFERAKKLAVVPQAAQVPDSYTAREAVLMGRTAYLGWLGRESDGDIGIARAAMERTRTTELAERRLGELSGGERQLVLIARALTQSARFLLLDEPTAHLDLRHEAAILELTRDLAARDGLGVLAALHDLNLASRHADRVALIAGGRLQACGAPRDILTEERLTEAYGVPITIFEDPSSGAPVVFART
jgi:iron complex transport system ATP-binding protein